VGGVGGGGAYARTDPKATSNIFGPHNQKVIYLLLMAARSISDIDYDIANGGYFLPRSSHIPIPGYIMIGQTSKHRTNTQL